jgi:hypothetical protein
MNNHIFGTALLVLITFPLRLISLQGQIQHGWCYVTPSFSPYGGVVSFGRIKRVGTH